jgi:hypothetical protein
MRATTVRGVSVLEKRDGEIVALRFVVGGRWRAAGF